MGEHIFWLNEAEHLEHLECSHPPHIQGRGAKKRPQPAGLPRSFFPNWREKIRLAASTLAQSDAFPARHAHHLRRQPPNAGSYLCGSTPVTDANLLNLHRFAPL